MKTKAYGVDEGWAPYRLRQARYWELGQDVASVARQHFQRHRRPIELLDVGVGDGVSRKYADVNSGAEHINWHGVDIFPIGQQHVYKRDQWSLYKMDLEHGLSGLPDSYFDIVICEQTLEHLCNVEFVLSGLFRVLRPTGLLVLGVPVFPHGLHVIRKHIVPVTDRWFGVKKKRGHVQAWSKCTFCQLIKQTCHHAANVKVRGFRIVSGGILRPLEYCKWWWRLNRWIGARVPSLCVEIQVLVTKPEETRSRCLHAA